MAGGRSPSDVRQFFGKLGWQNADTSLGLTVVLRQQLAHRQRPAGAAPAGARLRQRLHHAGHHREPVAGVQLHGAAQRRATSAFSGNVYYRYIRTNTLNGDLNEDSLDQSVYQPSAADMRALRAAGYTGFPASGATAANTPFPFWRCIAQALQRDEPGEKCNGLLNRTHTGQHNYRILRPGHLVRDARRVAQPIHRRAALRPQQRRLPAVSRTRLSESGPQRDRRGRVRRRRHRRQCGWRAVRYARRSPRPHPHRQRLCDRHAFRQGLELHAFGPLQPHHDRQPRPHPPVGQRTRSPATTPSAASIRPPASRSARAGSVNVYFSYSEGSRAPTSHRARLRRPGSALQAAECAWPAIRRWSRWSRSTFEAGVRGGLGGTLSWSAGWFRAREFATTFCSSPPPQTGFGYFKNFGQTRRQGLEADLHGRIRRLSLGGGYTFLDATYQSTETVDGSSNSTNDGSQASEEATSRSRPATAFRSRRGTC